MHFAPSEKELIEIPTMSANERLHYFLARAVECEEVWSLGDDHGWAIKQQAGQSAIPIWPYRALATACACGDCERQHPDAVSLEHFLYRVLALMSDNDIQVEILPSPDCAGMLMPAETLFEILDRKLDTGEYFLEG